VRWFAKIIRSTLRIGARLAGIAFLSLVALCFTNVPWRAWNWLATDPARASIEPQYVVVLGGGGIPSESGLVRAYHAAQVARQFSRATLIVALPAEGDAVGAAAGKTRDELVLRGVAPGRIEMETGGRNTREQALNVKKLIDGRAENAGVLIVTSPYHVRRALLAFRKAGFGNVAASAANSESIDANMVYNAKDLGGAALPLPNVGSQLTLRYRLWNNAGYLLEFTREWCALAYYKRMGWI
jgi:uncharacterized SAM-binding protein YcdF (DUF218 family)